MTLPVWSPVASRQVIVARRPSQLPRASQRASARLASEIDTIVFDSGSSLSPSHNTSLAKPGSSRSILPSWLASSAASAVKPLSAVAPVGSFVLLPNSSAPLVIAPSPSRSIAIHGVVAVGQSVAVGTPGANANRAPDWNATGRSSNDTTSGVSHCGLYAGP